MLSVDMVVMPTAQACLGCATLLRGLEDLWSVMWFGVGGFGFGNLFFIGFVV